MTSKFKVLQVVKTFDWRGNVVREDRSVVFVSENVVDTVKYRYEKAKGGCFVKCDDKISITLETMRDSFVIDFGEIFRIVEGDAAYLAVLNDEAEAVSESEWIATK